MIIHIDQTLCYNEVSVSAVTSSSSGVHSGEAASAATSCPRANWALQAETELVGSDWEAALRGGAGAHARAPRPLAAPIFVSSTYHLESAKEGKVLCNTLGQVTQTGLVLVLTIGAHAQRGLQ